MLKGWCVAGFFVTEFTEKHGGHGGGVAESVSLYELCVFSVRSVTQLRW